MMIIALWKLTFSPADLTAARVSVGVTFSVVLVALVKTEIVLVAIDTSLVVAGTWVSQELCQTETGRAKKKPKWRGGHFGGDTFC